MTGGAIGAIHSYDLMFYSKGRVEKSEVKRLQFLFSVLKIEAFGEKID